MITRLAMGPALVAVPFALFTADLRCQYAEGFDSSGSANVTIIEETGASATFVDYSAMTVGATNFSIPEAPRMVAGSAGTRGLLLQANVSAGVAAAVNVIAGAVPIDFAGTYTVSFDAYISVGTNPFPLTGSTEQLLWGIGVDNAGPAEARHNRFSGAMGTWGWLAGENGYGTEDAAIFEDGTELADLGDTQTGEGAPFNAAFTMPVTPSAPNNAPANEWVEVDIIVDAGNVRVLYNGVEFFNEASTATSGFAMLGYEDPFTSLSSEPDFQWGLFDNMTVTFSECFLLLGTNAWNVPLGGDILLVEPILVVPMTLTNLPSIDIPNNSGLVGLSIYTQSLLYNPYVFPSDPLKVSAGLDFEIGVSTTPYGSPSGMMIWPHGSPVLQPGGSLSVAFSIF